jgi:O-antigen/teichoic acid export membrane protein
MTLLGGRVGRDTLIYGSAGITTLVFGMVSLAVMTRLLAPAEFGDLAVLSVFATTTAVVYNIGSLQGTMSLVFGAGAGAGDEDGTGDVEDDADKNAEAARPRDRRKALGTGLALTAIVGAAGTAMIVLFAPTLGEVLVDRPDAAISVRWAAVAGLFAALWRLSVNVNKAERRPYAYLLVYSAHPVLTLGASVPLVATGYGVEGAMAGLAIGNAVAWTVALVAIRRSVRPAFSARDAIQIFRLGRSRAPLVLSFWLMANLDVLLVSRFVSAPQVGEYRVGARLGSLTMYWTSAFTLAWGTVARDPVYVAADRERGRGTQAMGALYFVMATVGIVLAIALFADILVSIASPEFADAAPLIPLVALAFAGRGCFVLSYRLSAFPRRIRWFVGLAVAGLVVFVAGTLILTPAIGIYGPAAALAVAYYSGATVILIRSQLSETPVPYAWRRMALALASGLACLGAVHGLHALVNVSRPLLEIVALLGYPVLLVATGVLPRSAVRMFRSLARATPQRWSRRSVVERLGELDGPDRELLELFARERLSVQNVAALNAVGEDVVLRRLVTILRQSAGLDGSTAACDPDIGRYILWAGAPAERDVIARRLWSRGIEPAEVHRMTMAFRSFRQATRAAWSTQPGQSSFARGSERSTNRDAT